MNQFAEPPDARGKTALVHRSAQATGVAPPGTLGRSDFSGLLDLSQSTVIYKTVARFADVANEDHL